MLNTLCSFLDVRSQITYWSVVNWICCFLTKPESDKDEVDQTVKTQPFERVDWVDCSQGCVEGMRVREVGK